MKLTKNFFALLIALTALSLAGCNKNKGEDDNTDYASAIAGTYVGNFKMKDTITVASDIELKFDRVDNKKVKLSLNKDITYSGLTIPLVNVSTDCDVTNPAEGTYGVKGSFTITIPIPEYSTEMPVTFAITGDITSGGAASLALSPSILGTPLELIGVVNFSGNKK